MFQVPLMANGWKIATGVLTVFSIGLIGIAAKLYNTAEDFYRRELVARLDPLDLNRKKPSIESNPDLPTIVFLGDSRAAMWPQPEYRANYINLGVNSQTTGQILERAKVELAGLHPDVVVIQAGVNDLKVCALLPEQKERIQKQALSNLEQIYGVAKSTGAEVIVTTIFPGAKPGLLDRARWNDSAIQAIIQINKAIRASHKDCLDAAKALSSDERAIADGLSLDLLHLNPNGYLILNQALKERLVKKL